MNGGSGLGDCDILMLDVVGHLEGGAVAEDDEAIDAADEDIGGGD